jgi:uncharacterized protein YndB with AHSA1/START domain
MAAKKSSSEPVSDRELFTSRTIDASPDRVFAAILDPAQLARWWGPNGFTNTFEEFQPRAGGKWRFVMHGPDGKDYPNESVFVDVTPPDRVIIRHASHPHFELTVTLEDVQGKTRIRWQQRFESAAECQRIAKFAIDANEQNLDRLTEVVIGRRD